LPENQALSQALTNKKLTQSLSFLPRLLNRDHRNQEALGVLEELTDMNRRLPGYHSYDSDDSMPSLPSVSNSSDEDKDDDEDE
jgi:hypothetical protein